MKIQILRNILEENDKLAEEIRNFTNSSKTLVLNIMSSPGSGKTRLLENIIPILKKQDIRVGVIEGDITTTNDADRISPLEVPIVQINTDNFGGDCHLGSEVIKPALDKLNIEKLDLVIIENVGNLVCPAEFDTGADINIVVISTTEGDDKPVKYPLMFRQCQMAIINKIDLLEYLDCDINLLKTNIKKINPTIDLSITSAKNGDGIQELVGKIIKKIKR